MSAEARGTLQRGVSLIELIIFIVIIGIALAALVAVINQVVRFSADPLVHKQALASAESLLEEIELQDFVSASGTTSAVTQNNRASAYHIVSDYNNFATSGIFPVSGTAPVTGLEGYNAKVAVADSALGGVSAVLITVTVGPPQGAAVQISGYRTAY